MKEIKLKGTFHEMGKQYGKACEKDIKTFAKMAYLMISLSKKPGSQPFNPNMWYFIPTLSQSLYPAALLRLGQAMVNVTLSSLRHEIPHSSAVGSFIAEMEIYARLAK